LHFAVSDRRDALKRAGEVRFQGRTDGVELKTGFDGDSFVFG